MDDFVFISVLITVCFLEVFFIVENILGLKSFYDNKTQKFQFQILPNLNRIWDYVISIING